MNKSQLITKFNFLKEKYYQNENSFQIIQCKYVISRSEIWNYLKNNNQIFGLDWQTVPRHVLISRLKMFWIKNRKLTTDLSITEISILVNNQQLTFNDDELQMLFSKTKIILIDIIKNIDNYHCLKIYKFIDYVNGINKEIFEKEVNALHKHIQKQIRALLKTMVHTKYVSNSQKETYLNLKRINFNDSNLNLLFEYHYVSDKTKYILQESPGALFKNANFRF